MSPPLAPTSAVVAAHRRSSTRRICRIRPATAAVVAPVCYHRGMKLRLVSCVGAVVMACGACPGGGQYKAPWQTAPTAAQEAAKLDAAAKAITSFKADSVMDYWLGKSRVKGDVKIMGKPGAFVRLNALNPAGSSVMADLACDGTNFVMVDFQNNCVLTGPCNADSIYQFLHVPLAPDDFFHLATGTSPLVTGTDGKVDWDSSTGHETITLGSDPQQTIVVDATNGHFDVLTSKLSSGGKDVWTIENKNFADAKDAAGKTFRIPGKSRFTAAGQKSDLIVEWTDVTLDEDLPLSKFQLNPPDGLPTCGQQQPPPPPPTAPHP